jgi:hypothetical protein
MDTQAASIDPVLVKLGEWAETQGLSREAVARRIGTSRTAVAGWLLALEAAQSGEEPPVSAREFRFTKQKPEVQAAIADVLNQPVEALRAESTGTTGPSAFEQEVQLALSKLALDRMPLANDGRQRYRIAELAEGVAGVAATAVVKVYRGSDHSVPYQYQVAVLIKAANGGAVGQERMIVDEVSRATSDLDCYWEYGPGQPEVQIHAGAGDLEMVGSLAVPSLAAMRAPQAGLFVVGDNTLDAGAGARGHGTEASAEGGRIIDLKDVALDRQRYLRLAAVITGAYGGAPPIAGTLAHRWKAGHLPADAYLGQLMRKDNKLYQPESAETNAGFVLHKAIHELERGNLPGAWLVSMEASSAQNYYPLDLAMAELDHVIMVVHLGDLWRRLAAWRLAGADLDHDRSKDAPGPRRPSPSNVEPFRCDVASAEGKTAFLEHAALAKSKREEVDRWEGYLADLARRRKEFGRPTMEVTLEHLPDVLRCARFDGETYTQAEGDGRLADMVAFEDLVDPMADVWAAAAEKFRAHLCYFALGKRDSSDWLNVII